MKIPKNKQKKCDLSISPWNIDAQLAKIFIICFCPACLIMVRVEETKNFGFGNPRLLEKALSGTELHRKLLLLTKKYQKYFSKMLKTYYLGRFFWVPIPIKQYQNMSGFAGDCSLIPKHKETVNSLLWWGLKACVCYFLSNFYFSPIDSPSKTMKIVLFHLKRSFRFQDIQIFVFLSSPLFLPHSHCLRGWLKIWFSFPVPFNRQSYQKQKGPGTNDQ